MLGRDAASTGPRTVHDGGGPLGFGHYPSVPSHRHRLSDTPMATRGSFRSQSSTTAPCRYTTATTARPGVPRTVKAPSPAAHDHELTLVLCSRPARVRVHSSSIPRVTARHRLPCRSMTRVGGENGQTRRYGVDPRGRTIVT